MESASVFAITPIVIVEENSPFQDQFVDRIVTFIESKTGFQFSPRKVFHLTSTENKLKKMREIEQLVLQENQVELIISGVSRQPDDIDFCTDDGPEEDRSREQPLFWPNSIYTPFVNMDKKILAEYYFENKLMDEFFGLTRSCTAKTQNFTSHCGSCWWCRERKWAFGTL